MVQTHTIKVYNRQTGISHTLEVPEDRYILHTAEHNGAELPFSCRNGACTTCAVRVVSGESVFTPTRPLLANRRLVLTTRPFFTLKEVLLIDISVPFPQSIVYYL
jgi:ferredoxin